MAISEKWKPVAGYEGYYEVSNFGNVRRVGGGRGAVPGRVLKRHLGTSGYPIVVLSRDGKEKTEMIHRLVAKAFIPLVDGKDFVNHKDGDRTNNRADNLEWVTRSENAIHYYSVLGGVKAPPPSDQKARKLGPEKVIKIFNSDGTYAEIGRRFGISDVMTRNIKLGICWSDVTCQSTT